MSHHVFNSGDDLSKDQLGLQVVQLPSSSDSREQVSTASILHNQIQPSAGLDHLVKAHYIGVAQLLHAADLGGGKRRILPIPTQLFHDFDSNSLCDNRGTNLKI